MVGIVMSGSYPDRIVKAKVIRDTLHKRLGVGRHVQVTTMFRRHDPDEIVARGMLKKLFTVDTAKQSWLLCVETDTFTRNIFQIISAISHNAALDNTAL